MYMQVAQREAIVSSTEIARLERDLGQARTAALSSGAGIQSRLQALQIACALIPSSITSPFSHAIIFFFCIQASRTSRKSGTPARRDRPCHSEKQHRDRHVQGGNFAAAENPSRHRGCGTVVTLDDM